VTYKYLNPSPGPGQLGEKREKIKRGLSLSKEQMGGRGETRPESNKKRLLIASTESHGSYKPRKLIHMKKFAHGSERENLGASLSAGK